MGVTDPHRAPEDIARLGSVAFDHHVRPRLRPDDDGKFVALDIETGGARLGRGRRSARRNAVASGLRVTGSGRSRRVRGDQPSALAR
jgi:hypothetical protein